MKREAASKERKTGNGQRKREAGERGLWAHRSLRYCIIKMHLTSIGFSKVDNPIQKAVLSQEKESRNSFKNQLLMKKVRFLLLKGEKV